MKYLSPLFNLFYPIECLCCSTPLLDQEELICITCRFDLPFADNGNFISNTTTRIFEGRIAIEVGASLLLYGETGKSKDLIHELKYKGNQQIGVLFANWFSSQLKIMHKTHNFNVIIPVPLHLKKMKKRGYNQLTTFGEQLSKTLNIVYSDNILTRISFTNTQTKKKRIDRFQNTNSKFFIDEPELLAGKHILLVDDVVTTGATLEACCKELQKAHGIKISIVTMAVTE